MHLTIRQNMLEAPYLRVSRSNIQLGQGTNHADEL